MDAEDSAEVSERLGPYRLVTRIGAGGMGVVYLGLDADRRTVAVKVLRPQVAADDVSRARLAREVETMRRVASPHVAEVLDADLHGERPYIATRYVQGRTLDEVVSSDGPLAGPALARAAEGLASALSAIHAAGVIHRDVKPSNVVLVDGEPVMIDFGVAQAADASKLTQTGMFMGTPAYLAPEILEGDALTSAADIHAWAAVMAYAATGRSPFGSGSFETVFSNIAQGRADLAGVPEPLAGLARAALARDPQGRPEATWLQERSSRLHGSLGQSGSAAVDSAATAVGARVRHPGTAGSVAGGAAAPAASARHGQPDPQGFAQRDMAGSTSAVSSARHAESPASPTTRHDRPESPSTRAYTSYAPPAPSRGAGGEPGTVPDLPPAQPDAGEAAEQRPVPQQPRPRPPRQPRPLVGWLLLAVLAGFTGIVPVVGVILVAVILVGLRTVAGVQRGLQARRSRRGPRDVDALLGVAASPWHVTRASVATLVHLLLPTATGTALIAVLSPPLSYGPSYVSVLVGACAFVLLTFFGPGGDQPRQQAQRVLSGVLRGRTATVVTVVGAVLLLMLEMSAFQQGVYGSWPAPVPDGLWNMP